MKKADKMKQIKNGFMKKFFTSKESLLQSIQVDFKFLQPIQKMLFCFAKFQRSQRFAKLLSKSQQTLDKELDLRKFIHRQRVQTTAVLGLLSSNQSLFVDKMSELVIRESSNFEEESSDKELYEVYNENEIYTEKITKS